MACHKGSDAQFAEEINEKEKKDPAMDYNNAVTGVECK